MAQPKEQFCKKSPCSSCPYRMDAPLELWDRDHYIQLLKDDRDALGHTYLCHKKDGKMCTGYIMNQDKRDFPSILLRYQMIEENVTRKFLDSLKCETEMFETIEDMVEANFPELLELDIPDKEIMDYVNEQLSKLDNGHLERESPAGNQNRTSGNEG